MPKVDQNSVNIKINQFLDYLGHSCEDNGYAINDEDQVKNLVLGEEYLAG